MIVRNWLSICVCSFDPAIGFVVWLRQMVFGSDRFAGFLIRSYSHTVALEMVELHIGRHFYYLRDVYAQGILFKNQLEKDTRYIAPEQKRRFRLL